MVNANCSQNDACEQTMGNLIHKTHHGLDLGQMHHSPSYNIYLYLTMGLHEFSICQVVTFAPLWSRNFYIKFLFEEFLIEKL